MNGPDSRQELALQVIDLAKTAVLVDNHFLAAAIGRLRVEPMEVPAPFATDGYFLAYDAGRVLRAFLATREPPEHDLMHAVAHCLFLHPYVDSGIERRFWDLACDIAAERVVMELLGPRSGADGAAIAQVIERVERDMRGRADAERLYRNLREGRWADLVPVWEPLMRSDSHKLWYSPSDSHDEAQGSGAGEGTESRGGVGRMEGVSESVNRSGSGQTGQSEERADGEQEQGEGQGRSAESGRNASDATGGGGNAAGPQGEASSQADRPPTGASGSAQSSMSSDGKSAQPSKGQQQAGWRNVANSLAIQLQTLSSRRGGQLPGFLDDLIAVNEEHMDYATFLRSFATTGEVMRLSDDEFDQVFYTYGLQLYGNLPLIEPLEYREERRVREFVIVIDTSGSVRGEAVRQFVTATFDILKATEAFFDHVNLRILQCDVRVHSDDVITNLADLTRWGQGMRVQGGGGTDFRPAIAYVDQLVEEGAFHDLGGLVYFTDGWGTYPDWVPSYRCAFAFYDENHRPETVPPWAVQIVLSDHALAVGSHPTVRKEIAFS